MSRLDSHRRKQFIKKLIFIVVFIVILTAILFNVGFNALINSSIFFSKIFSSKSDQDTPVQDNFFGTLHIDSIPTATNSARFVISGSATNFKTVEYYINDEKVSSHSIADMPSFTDEVGDLKKGANNVFIKVITEDKKKEKKSDVYTVLYSDEKPKLEISEPQDNSKTTKSDLTIKGTTDKEITIQANQMPVIVDATGKFQTTIRLKEGENKIEIAATDDAGNMEKKTLTVTYQKDE